jgi:hypothetical protein
MDLHAFANLATVVEKLDSTNPDVALTALRTLRLHGVVWSDLCWQLLDALTSPTAPQPPATEPPREPKPKRAPSDKVPPLAKRLAARAEGARKHQARKAAKAAPRLQRRPLRTDSEPLQNPMSD